MSGAAPSGIRAKTEGSVSREHLKQALENLTKYMPGETDAVYGFGRYLADTIESDLLPLGFANKAQWAVEALQRGRDTFTGEPISNELIGLAQPEYEVLRSVYPAIARVICPKEFADEVEHIYVDRERKS